MTLADIAAALLRTTLVTSFAAVIAWGLLAGLRVRSPRIHRVAWLLVIAQGWLFFPLTIEIKSTEPSPPKRAAGLVPAVIAEQELIAYENEVLRGRGPFATDDSPMVENPQSQKVPDPAPLAIAAWLLGAMALVAIAVQRHLRVLRTFPLGSPADDSQWLAEWETAQRDAAPRRCRAVELRITAALGPLLHWAPWSYFILVPRPLWSSLERTERTAILRHELAHLRRHDLWKSMAIRVLALPQWFNLLAWLAVRRFDEAAEWACDDAAARDADDRLAFANSLLQSAEYALAPYPGSAPAARGVLTRRIHRLVSPRFKEESKMKLLILPLLLLSTTASQVFRIERIAVAEEMRPQPELKSPLNDDAAAFDTPLEERLEQTMKLRAKLQLAAKVELQFARSAQVEYVIESPDIVTIKLRGKQAALAAGVKEAPDVPAEFFSGKRCLVLANGTIDLGEYGFAEVGGKTVDEAMRAVARKFMQFTNGVSLVVEEYNSKVFYVIVEDANGVPRVTRMPLPYPLRRDCNVGSAIEAEFADDDAASSPDLSQCSIYVLASAPKNAGEGRRYDVEWDGSKSAPKDYANFPLFPGDRLFIAFPRDAKAAKAKSGSHSATPPAVVPAESEYRLQPYDTIKLHVQRPHRPAYALTWGDFEGEFTVTQFGDVELGSFGIVEVAGLTVDEASAAIEHRLRKTAPRCEVSLTLGMLAEEKYVIEIQRPDGTEVAAGALSPAGFSEAEFSDFRSFVSDLASIRGVKLERQASDGTVRTVWLSTIWDAVQSPTLPPCEHRVRGGDRLVLTVDQDWKTHRYPPAWLVTSNAESDRDYGTIRFRPGWRALYSTQFDHPDVQLPAGPQYSR